jgi:hypothetical protein
MDNISTLRALRNGTLIYCVQKLTAGMPDPQTAKLYYEIGKWLTLEILDRENSIW